MKEEEEEEEREREVERELETNAIDDSSAEDDADSNMERGSFSVSKILNLPLLCLFLVSCASYKFVCCCCSTELIPIV